MSAGSSVSVGMLAWWRLTTERPVRGSVMSPALGNPVIMETLFSSS